MRVLAFADEPPPDHPAELARLNHPDALLTLGDLDPEWIAALGEIDIPRFGVHGNHDADGQLEALGVRDIHLAREQVDGWSFAGFEGCVRYGQGPHQYTQDEATRLVESLPEADVLVCHAPPWGVNDEADDPAHVGFVALRKWVEQHEPLYVLHGHTTPDPRTRTWRLGRTQVVWVRGIAVIEL